ncbi:MAG: polysaccharide deacetylase family protein [Myxococcales bacterium]|nr:polysaccharide deacetylase family protein [Myxococcales bacterium]
MRSKSGALVVAVLLLCLCAWPLRATPTVGGLGERLGAGRTISGGTPHRLIHFTFDDGPDARTTPRLLDELDRLGIKATFFFSASRFRGRERRNRDAPALARDVLSRGHSVGSHSVDHQRMARLSPRALRAQLDENDRLFFEVFGQRTFLFRPPFGSTNAALDRLLAARGYTNVMWNVGLADWVERPPEQLLRTFVRVLRRNEREHGQRGGVVLLHDTHAWTVDALRLLVGHLRDRNCELLGDPEAELYDVVDSLEPFYQAANPERPGQVADLALLGPEAMNTRQQRLRAQTIARCQASVAR